VSNDVGDGELVTAQVQAQRELTLCGGEAVVILQGFEAVYLVIYLFHAGGISGGAYAAGGCLVRAEVTYIIHRHVEAVWLPQPMQVSAGHGTRPGGV
jgi:hypothetical protein